MLAHDRCLSQSYYVTQHSCAMRIDLLSVSQEKVAVTKKKESVTSLSV